MAEHIVKQQFREWLYSMYDTTYLSTYFFNTLESVYIGSYKNLNTAIPLEDLWELWKLQKSDLEKIHDTQRRKGKEIEQGLLPLYDLAIVVSHYDEYIKVKERLKRAQAERASYQSKINVDYKKLNIKKPHQRIDLESIINKI